MPRRKKIPLQTKIDVLIEAGYRCGNPACNIVLTPDILEDHHIIGVAAGGGNEAANLLALCPVCHSLYTHAKITPDAIRHWKRMLVALNHAYSREAMDLLVFLNSRADRLTCSTDGMLRFVGLMNAGLVECELHPLTPDIFVEATAVRANTEAEIQQMYERLDDVFLKARKMAAAAATAPPGVTDPSVSKDAQDLTFEMVDLECDISCAGDLVQELRGDMSWYRPLLYRLTLTDRGRMLVEAWLSGNESAYLRTLEQPSEEPAGDAAEQPLPS